MVVLWIAAAVSVVFGSVVGVVHERADDSGTPPLASWAWGIGVVLFTVGVALWNLWADDPQDDPAPGPVDDSSVDRTDHQEHALRGPR